MIAFSSSLDQAGPIARTEEDCAFLLNEMCSHEEKDTTSNDEVIPHFAENLNSSIQGLKIGLVKEFDLSKLDNDVVQVFEESKNIMNPWVLNLLRYHFLIYLYQSYLLCCCSGRMLIKLITIRWS